MKRTLVIFSIALLSFVFAGAAFACPGSEGGGCGCSKEQKETITATATTTDSGAILRIASSDPDVAANVLEKLQTKAQADKTGEGCPKKLASSPFAMEGVDFVIEGTDSGVTVTFTATNATAEVLADLQARVQAKADHFAGKEAHDCKGGCKGGCGS